MSEESDNLLEKVTRDLDEGEDIVLTMESN